VNVYSVVAPDVSVLNEVASRMSAHIRSSAPLARWIARL
jgi:hypothetical protein